MADHHEPRPVVYLGPTLPEAEAEQIVAAIYRPPASQGSIVSDIQSYHPSAILLIDGVFQGEPAVRHKEILWALSQGIPVIGAASMGALRAAELWRYGMIGVGLIFRWYRRFRFLPDDAVAVLHGPAELGSPGLTRALIDIRMTVRQAERVGLVDREVRVKLERAAAALNFRDRTVERVVSLALGDSNGSSHAKAHDLVAKLDEIFVGQKKADAVCALRFLQRLNLATSPIVQRRREFVTTTAFLRDLRHSGIELK